MDFFQTNNLAASRYLGESCMWLPPPHHKKNQNGAKLCSETLLFLNFSSCFNLKKE